MIQKKTRNLLLAILATFMVMLVTIATLFSVRAPNKVRADNAETVEYKTLYVGGEIKYLYDLKVGDTIYGKTLIFPTSINDKFESTIMLSNGDKIYYKDIDPIMLGSEADGMMWYFNFTNIGEPESFTHYPFNGNDGDNFVGGVIDNSNINTLGTEVERIIPKDVTVVSIENKSSTVGVMYLLDEPIPEEVEDVEEDTKWFNNVSVWLEENTGMVISGSAIGTFVVLVVVYKLFFSKRR